ncbi:T9SS type A sorting domain-containing protein [Adhaeribacter swui]|uniref:T9SS type A sorting domain-containing protein n=1 Tax=Adhaeribacter swui TaxID=2086471 RepID=A0A7G7GAE1_9BACT|nr:T9SS type A sorting domain-containing protein [Adhaeribacter swui]QNF34125.1 T9SS type A sorting domain-containing protein [Adhaeribacter swui]
MKKIILLLGAFLCCLTIGAQVKAPIALRSEKPQVLVPTNQDTDKRVNVYPNPSTGKVFLELSGFKGKRTEVQVTNVIGNVILRDSFNETEDQTLKVLDLSNVASGLYYVKLEADEYSEIRKVIVN